MSEASMSSQPLLNHPYTIYPREPTSAYTKYRLYNVELYRLYNFNNIKIKEGVNRQVSPL